MICDDLTFSDLQGFASGDMDRDAAALRLFVDEGHTVLLAQVTSLTVASKSSTTVVHSSTTIGPWYYHSGGTTLWLPQ